jgi:hypothetical protein
VSIQVANSPFSYGEPNLFAYAAAWRGAWDFYEEKGIQDKEHASKAEKLFPKSIMLHENKDIYSCQFDEVTAWLV